jgi:hypothetical protein
MQNSILATRSSVDARPRPTINFHGTITTRQGAAYNVENITISGMYKQIPFYEEPADEAINPASHTTFIDLDTIKTITPQHAESAIIFRNREYTRVYITLKGTEQKSGHYLVESSRRIFCDIKLTTGLLEKELTFNVIQKIAIEDFTYHARQEEQQKSKKPSAAKKALCNDAQKYIKQLETSCPNDTQTIKKLDEILFNFCKNSSYELQQYEK